MRPEFLACYPFALKEGVVQAYAIDFLAGKQPEPPTRWTDLSEIEDDWTRLIVLSQAIGTPYKDQARVGMRRDAGGYRYWLKNRSSAFLKKRLNEMRAINLDTLIPPISSFPHGTWSLRLAFALHKPYISRDDADFYIIDNPLKKDWIFKVPYIAPSQWKGALRSAMMRELVAELHEGKIDNEAFIKKRICYFRLFGNEKDGVSKFFGSALASNIVGEPAIGNQEDREWKRKFEAKVKEIGDEFESRLEKSGYRKDDIEGFKGYLHFYPTYFDQIGLEVINPHDRETGGGKNPIYFECVPKGTNGTFSLLYVPLTEPEVNEENAKEDLKAIARGIRSMMTCYGFGAKTSSGFGVVDSSSIVPTLEPLDLKSAWDEGWK